MPPEEFQFGQTVQDNFEAESQFILRLPSLPAASLRAAVKSGVLNLKDRLSIQLDTDIRNGVVRFDGWTLPSKIVDLPTIIDCHKTLDNKNFHKSADISQMMICKEEADEVKEPEPEEAQKKTKDGRDKRYIYPHGVTKPLKNVWKKRFRKTLRKKSVDFPEIESEVKRLFRFDNEAVSVRYEIVDIEEDNKTTSKDRASRSGAMNSEYDVGDLFGDVVSSSDEDDSEDNSRSIGFKDYLKDDVEGGQSQQGYSSFSQILQQHQQPSTSTASAAMMNEESESQMENEGIAAASNLELGNINESLRRKAEELESEIANIETQKQSQQLELDGIENMALKQRFQAIIDDLNEQKDAKMRELEDLKCLI